MALRKTILIAAIALVGAPDQMVSAQRPPSSKWVEFGSGELVKTANGYALVYGISTSTRESLYALVEISHPDGSRRCECLKKFVRRRVAIECGPHFATIICQCREII